MRRELSDEDIAEMKYGPEPEYHRCIICDEAVIDEVNDIDEPHVRLDMVEVYACALCASDAIARYVGGETVPDTHAECGVALAGVGDDCLTQRHDEQIAKLKSKIKQQERLIEQYRRRYERGE